MRPVVTILGAGPAGGTAAPALAFRLRVETLEPVQAMLLRCQVQLDARRRRYDEQEQRRLYELFGPAADFPRALRPILWTHAALSLPAVERVLDCDLVVPCTYDLQVAGAKYLHALRGGDIPLRFLFAGSIFRIVDGAMTLEPVPWDVEATFKLPAQTWHAAVAQFFGGDGWIRLRPETIDRLQTYRGRSAMLTWDAAIEALLTGRDAGGSDLPREDAS